jgi:BirA family biotin operon repressor/biotin-[acetyl-CoA-carboxylase] ligase
VADDDAILAPDYDWLSPEELADDVGVPRVIVYERVTSTLDAAHRFAAAGAASGTLVLAQTQTAGRGRQGRPWSSPRGAGIWLTLIERPTDRDALDVLSLRVGMAAARALDPFAAEPVRLKWPNDIYVEGKKLAGILVEARWRDERPEWVAIGLGVNVVAPDDQPNAAGLDAGVSRVDVLRALMSELRPIVNRPGLLGAEELEEFAARDLARGKQCVEPARGRVRGISARGELMVELADSVAALRSGSLVFAE